MIEQILAHARVGAELHRTDTDLDVVLASVLEDLAPTLEAQVGERRGGRAADAARRRAAALLGAAQPRLQRGEVRASRRARPSSRCPPSAAARAGDSRCATTASASRAGDRDLVFGLFNRVETSVDGSGIGLATVKRIIEAHGGTIGISSVEGPGTDVWFELPAAARGHDEPGGTRRPDGSPSSREGDHRHHDGDERPRVLSKHLDEH